MGLSMDHFLRINDLPATPKPPTRPKPATTPVDASDRKFYIRAAEQGNGQALKDFDAALAAQSKPAPKPASAPSVVPQKPHVQPERASDPSDQKLYNMAADHQNKIIALENRAARLEYGIDALGVSGGYAAQAMQDELAVVDEELQSLRPKPQATLDPSLGGYVRPPRAEDPSDQKFYNMAADRQNKVIDLEREAATLRHNIDVLGTTGGYAGQAMLDRLKEIEQELQGLNPTPGGGGDLGGTYTRNVRTPFFVDAEGDESRGQAAIVRTLADTGDGGQIQNDEFEIIQHNNGAYTVVLPGVIDLSKPHLGLDPTNDSVRDVDQNAFPSSRSASVEDNAYAQMVREYILANVPPGANVMLVGHSYGGDTVLDLASDPTFNNTTTGVNVTHAVAAAYHSQPQLDHVQDHTQVLVLQNRQDIPVIVEGLGHPITNPPPINFSSAQDYAGRSTGAAWDYAGETIRDLPGGAREVFGFGTSLLRGDLGGAFDHTRTVASGIIRNGVPVAVPGPLAEPFAPAGITNPNDHTIVARFDSGYSRAGHGQEHYIGFVNETDDPAIAAFYRSVSAGGYADTGTSYAVDVSVPESDRKPSYPGASVVEAGRGFWNRLPGNDIAETVVIDGGRFAGGKALEIGGALTGEDRVGDLVDAVPYRNSMSAAGQALLGREVINLDDDAIQQIQADPAFVAREAAIVDAVQTIEGYGERPLTIPLSELDGIPTGLELGGQRGQSDLGHQLTHAYDLSDPDVRATWQVAGSDLTWLLRHSNVDGTAHVDAQGNITIDYSVNDVLDLRPGEGRNAWYNRVTTVTGAVWHDVLGAEESRVVGNFQTNPATSTG